jgi:glyoxylase-like metal-dependent hydrolase (beta-lactamase superfamily II)
MRISYLPDGMIQLAPIQFFPSSTPEHWRHHAELVDGDGYLVASVGSLLVETKTRSLLIDAGYGSRHMSADQTAPEVGAVSCGELLNSFAAAGTDPASIEAVAFTHLHEDHIGWAAPSSTGWTSPFSVATWLVAGDEVRQQLSLTGRVPLDSWPDRVREVSAGEEIFPGVSVLPTPGHTPGHCSYAVTAGATRVIVVGDAMHSPAQVRHPEWQVQSDWDDGQAASSRLTLLGQLRAEGTTGFAVHFADVIFGRVVRARDGMSWSPIAWP